MEEDLAPLVEALRTENEGLRIKLEETSLWLNYALPALTQVMYNCNRIVPEGHEGCPYDLTLDKIYKIAMGGLLPKFLKKDSATRRKENILAANENKSQIDWLEERMHDCERLLVDTPETAVRAREQLLNRIAVLKKEWRVRIQQPHDPRLYR
jgi:hypothetical protein